MQVKWRDDTAIWVPLNALKESHQVEGAEYAVANQTAEESAFAWWGTERLARESQDQILGKEPAQVRH